MHWPHKHNHAVVVASPKDDSMTKAVKENVERQRQYLRDVERVLAGSK